MVRRAVLTAKRGAFGAIWIKRACGMTIAVGVKCFARRGYGASVHGIAIGGIVVRRNRFAFAADKMCHLVDRFHPVANTVIAMNFAWGLGERWNCHGKRGGVGSHKRSGRTSALMAAQQRPTISARTLFPCAIQHHPPSIPPTRSPTLPRL